MLLTAGCDHIIDSAGKILNVLGHQSHANFACANHFARIGDNVLMKQLHQGGLARAVSSQKPDSFTRFNLERRAIEQQRPAEAHRNIIDP